jgi:hypothetical protein
VAVVLAAHNLLLVIQVQRILAGEVAAQAKVVRLVEPAAQELLLFVTDTIKYPKGEYYGTNTI